MSERYRIVFMVGMPLSGKSTFGKELAGFSGKEYFSTGAFARELGMGREDSIKFGDISDKFNDRINNKLYDILWGDESWIVDGWPRSKEQLDKLFEYSKQTGQNDWIVVYCYLNPIEILTRAKTRRRDDNDEEEVVMGRIRASIEFNGLLKELSVDGCSIDMADDTAKERIKTLLSEDSKEGGDVHRQG